MTKIQPIVLFPHTHITPVNLEKITHRFGRLMICLPWFMDGPGGEKEGVDLSSIDIKRPPAYMKPKADFKELVSEYQLWIKQNRDKGRPSMLGSSEGLSPSGETQWEIRKMISLAGAGGQLNSVDEQALKWHIILHLAREFEENRDDAEEILGRLKDQRSPLEGALEDDTDRQFFEDTPLMSAQLRIAEYPLNQLIEAWFGLFGELLPDNASLITIDPNVVSYVTDMLVPDEFIIRPEENAGEGSLAGSDADKAGFRVTRLPEADNPDAGNSKVIKGLSGKTIILMEG